MARTTLRSSLARPAAGLAAFGLAALAGLAMPAFGEQAAQAGSRQAEALPPERAWPAPTNAAPIYWRAIHLYSNSAELKDADWSSMLTSDDESGYELTGSEREQIAKAGLMIEMVLRASRVEACNWEVDYDLGIEAILPHLGPIRMMARLLAIDVRRCVMEGDLDGAVERLGAMHALARHLRSDGVLISGLVSCAIVSMASDQTSQFLARVDLTSEQRGVLLASLDAHDESDPFGVRASVLNEGNWLTYWLEREILAGRFAERAREFLDHGAEGADETMAALRRLSNEALIEDLRECRRYYAEAHAMWNDRDAGDRLEMLGRLVEQGRFGMIARVMAAALSRAHSADWRSRNAIESSRREILSDPLAPSPH